MTTQLHTDQAIRNEWHLGAFKSLSTWQHLQLKKSSWINWRRDLGQLHFNKQNQLRRDSNFASMQRLTNPTWRYHIAIINKHHHQSCQYVTINEMPIKRPIKNLNDESIVIKSNENFEPWQSFQLWPWTRTQPKVLPIEAIDISIHQLRQRLCKVDVEQNVTSTLLIAQINTSATPRTESDVLHSLPTSR